MRIVLVVNPRARAVRGELARSIAERWSARHQVTVVHSSGKGMAVDLTAEHLAADAVAVLGGDGIVNDVANALADARSSAVLVPLPAGTTNVVARSLGLPSGTAEAAEVALRALEQGAVARRGWGRLNGRGFLANAGIGLDAAVVARTEARPARKQRWGHGWFSAAALAELCTGALHTRLTMLDPADPSGARQPATARTACWVLALAGHPYTYLGRRPLELLPPGTSFDDGLWLIAFAPQRASAMARLALTAAVSSQGIADAEGVALQQIASATTWRSERPTPWQTDGEPWPPQDTFRLEWQPDALTLLAPRPPTADVGGRRRVAPPARWSARLRHRARRRNAAPAGVRPAP